MKAGETAITSGTAFKTFSNFPTSNVFIRGFGNEHVKKTILLLALLLLPLSLAQGCDDIVSGQLLQNVQIPILSQTTSPTADMVRVVFFRKMSLEIGPVVNNWLYVMPSDTIALVDPGYGGTPKNQTIGYAGWFYYLALNESGYFRIQTNSSKFSYACENGATLELEATARLGGTLKLDGGRTVVADFVRVKAGETAFYSSDYFVASDEFVVITRNSTDSAGNVVARGSMFARQDGVYHFVGARGRTELADVYPSMKFLGCCSSGKCSSDFKSELAASSCSSDLFSAKSACLGGNSLGAFPSCSAGNVCVPSIITCKYGCANGSCVDGTEPECRSFYEPSVFVRNSISGVYQNKTQFGFTNACEDGKVRVWSCEGSAPKSATFGCDFGCAAGVCLNKTAGVALPSTAAASPPVFKQPLIPENGYWLGAGVLVLFTAAAYLLFSRKLGFLNRKPKRK